MQVDLVPGVDDRVRWQASCWPVEAEATKSRGSNVARRPELVAAGRVDGSTGDGVQRSGPGGLISMRIP